jgi:RNA polymerase sigma-70 factor (ECF subfamily)
MTNQEIDIIIKGCNATDRISQKKLYEVSYISLASVVALYVKDDSERDWVFNLGMLKVYNSLNSFAKGTNYLAWARTILVRTAIDHVRSQIKQISMVTSLESHHYNQKDENLEYVLGQLAADDIIKAIQNLAINEKIVFTLFEIEGYSHREIESMTGIKENTSKWLLNKAKTSLKKYVNLFSKLPNSLQK